ncbi:MULTISPECIES: LysR family transcriptional regulator [Vibrio]|jgi:DNA-binding transcriptional LysR family regulator|uniref:LysR family transcriptional regulator n=1 Tax=Vibrio kanaloae TaxID=170673 RepID=A0A2N7J959_9VIBR|nr:MULTISPECIES: LysR family transcriptional regulator [Vibrio]MCG9557211.1 LysR family transcriptional regulator [Vibrio kanaloae]NOJ00512.1 LysR family transcriptional regulator [Vibrio kanaloae]OEF13123.1 LysR family transcriptional regulator [Vibrio kanaloae 5S-149]PMM02739.1 LysR family transcriptional regulator [Vibrio kanaloae]QPK04562.1 LysR family transcriptional regulator [Vibrio kanaloae]
MHHFNIRALEYLNALSKYGSLRNASKMMNVDPAAMSRMLTQLEAQAEMKVWERNNRHSLLTEAGNELLNYYRSVVRGEAAVLARLTKLKNLQGGNVSIAIGEGFITNLVAKPMQTFMTRYPDINLSIEIAGALDAVKMLEDQQIDFAITYASAPHPKLHSHVERSHPLELIVPKGHFLTSKEAPITLQDIKDVSVALIDNSTGMGRLVKHAEQVSHLTLQPKLQTNSVTALTNFVSAGLGVTFMPKLTVIDEIKSGQIEVVATELEMLSKATVKVQSLKGRALTLQAETLLGFLLENATFLSHDAYNI